MSKPFFILHLSLHRLDCVAIKWTWTTLEEGLNLFPKLSSISRWCAFYAIECAVTFRNVYGHVSHMQVYVFMARYTVCLHLCRSLCVFMCVHVWLYCVWACAVHAHTCVWVHVCVCVKKRWRLGLMPCCQRTPDDEVVKPQQDGKKKKKSE